MLQFVSSLETFTDLEGDLINYENGVVLHNLRIMKMDVELKYIKDKYATDMSYAADMHRLKMSEMNEMKRVERHKRDAAMKNIDDTTAVLQEFIAKRARLI